MEEWILTTLKDAGSLSLVGAVLVGAFVLVQRNVIVPGNLADLRGENRELKVRLEEREKDVVELRARVEGLQASLDTAVQQIKTLETRLAALP